MPFESTNAIDIPFQIKESEIHSNDLREVISIDRQPLNSPISYRYSDYYLSPNSLIKKASYTNNKSNANTVLSTQTLNPFSESLEIGYLKPSKTLQVSDYRKTYPGKPWIEPPTENQDISVHNSHSQGKIIKKQPSLSDKEQNLLIQNNYYNDYSNIKAETIYPPLGIPPSKTNLIINRNCSKNYFNTYACSSSSREALPNNFISFAADQAASSCAKSNTNLRTKHDQDYLMDPLFRSDVCTVDIEQPALKPLKHFSPRGLQKSWKTVRNVLAWVAVSFLMTINVVLVLPGLSVVLKMTAVTILSGMLTLIMVTIIGSYFIENYSTTTKAIDIENSTCEADELQKIQLQAQVLRTMQRMSKKTIKTFLLDLTQSQDDSFTSQSLNTFDDLDSWCSNPRISDENNKSDNTNNNTYINTSQTFKSDKKEVASRSFHSFQPIVDGILSSTSNTYAILKDDNLWKRGNRERILNSNQSRKSAQNVGHFIHKDWFNIAEFPVENSRPLPYLKPYSTEIADKLMSKFVLTHANLA